MECRDERDDSILHAYAMFAMILIIIFLQVLNVRLFEVITHSESDPYNGFITTKILMIMGCIVTILFARFTSIKLNLRYIIKKGVMPNKELIFTISIIVTVIVGMIITRLVVEQFNEDIATRPFFGLYLSYHARWSYPITCFGQEVYMKVVMQENFTNLCGRKNKHLGILFTALFFGILHMGYNWYLAIGAFVFCIVTGYLYERYKSIWGLTVIHAVIGFLPRCFGFVG